MKIDTQKQQVLLDNVLFLFPKADGFSFSSFLFLVSEELNLKEAFQNTCTIE